MSGPYSVTDTEGIEPGETAPTLDTFDSWDEAEDFVLNLPDHKSGRYVIVGSEWEDAWAEDDGDLCYECGDPMFVEWDGISHHGAPGEIDYETDATHVAISMDGMDL